MTIDQTILLAIFSASALWFLLFYIFADVPYKRKKAREALLKASMMRRAGVWPPAPIPPEEPQEPEPWAWCMVCHRASSMEAISDNSGYCTYKDCLSSVHGMILWCDLKERIFALPAQPEAGVVYVEPIQVTEIKPESG